MALSVVAVGVVAGGINLIVRPEGQQVEFLDGNALATQGPVRPTVAGPGWTTVVVHDAAFDVPSAWRVYGDDGLWEYRFCDVGYIGPAVFVVHPLPRNWGCGAAGRGPMTASSIELVTTALADEDDMFSRWLDQAPRRVQMGGEPVTRWEPGEDQPAGWTLVRFDRLNMFAEARTDLDPPVVTKILESFRKATDADRAADDARRAPAIARWAERDWELAEQWMGPAGPAQPPGAAPESIAGNQAALDTVQGHFEAVVEQKLQQTPVSSDGSRGVSLTPEEAFAVVSESFNRCQDTTIGPVESAPPKPAAEDLQMHRRFSIRPRLDTIDSCSEWFAVDVYVDRSGEPRGATLDRGQS